MSTRITIERPRKRDTIGSESASITDGTNSSPVEVHSGSRTTASAELVERSDEEWEQLRGDDIEPSESASRLPISSGRRIYVETGPAAPSRRESSRRRVAVPEPRPHRRHKREQREEREERESREHRSQHHRRRAPSTQSGSVGSREEYEFARRAHHAAQHPPPQYYVSHEQAGYAPQVGYAPPNLAYGYNPLTNPMAPPGAQLALYEPHNPYAYFPNPLAYPPPFSPPSQTSNSTGYFSHDSRQHSAPMGVMPYPTMYSYPFPVLSTSPPAAAPAPAPAAPAGPSEEDKFKTLQALLISQEADRVARENERFAVAEAKLAKELADKLAAEALAAATKKAKEDAEAEAGQKAKDAAEKHKKALDEAKAATETAKKGEEEAKAEAEKHKPGDDAGKGPIRFKDAVGRKFCFPWAVCKTWKGMEELIKQAFLHVDVIGQHVQEGHYDLMGPDGEIVLPQVWERTVLPDWLITMHMWPMPEPPKKVEKVVEIPIIGGPVHGFAPPPAHTVSYDMFGRPKKKKHSKSSSGAVIIPPPPMAPMVPGAGIPPPPPGVVAMDPFMASATPGIESPGCTASYFDYASYATLYPSSDFASYSSRYASYSTLYASSDLASYSSEYASYSSEYASYSSLYASHSTLPYASYSSYASAFATTGPHPIGGPLQAPSTRTSTSTAATSKPSASSLTPSSASAGFTTSISGTQVVLPIITGGAGALSASNSRSFVAASASSFASAASASAASAASATSASATSASASSAASASKSASSAASASKSASSVVAAASTTGAKSASSAVLAATTTTVPVALGTTASVAKGTTASLLGVGQAAVTGSGTSGAGRVVVGLMSAVVVVLGLLGSTVGLL